MKGHDCDKSSQCSLEYILNMGQALDSMALAPYQEKVCRGAYGNIHAPQRLLQIDYGRHFESTYTAISVKLEPKKRVNPTEIYPQNQMLLYLREEDFCLLSAPYHRSDGTRGKSLI